ncbi:hypothetical protein COOONC_25379 [Cooperia oncophora]
MHLVNGVGAWGGFGCNLQLGPSQRRSVVRRSTVHLSRPNSYLAVINEIGKDHIADILDRPLPFVCRRAVRRDRFHITLNGQVTVSIVPSTGRMCKLMIIGSLFLLFWLDVYCAIATQVRDVSNFHSDGTTFSVV